MGLRVTLGPGAKIGMGTLLGRGAKFGLWAAIGPGAMAMGTGVAMGTGAVSPTTGDLKPKFFVKRLFHIRLRPLFILVHPGSSGKHKPKKKSVESFHFLTQSPVYLIDTMIFLGCHRSKIFLGCFLKIF